MKISKVSSLLIVAVTLAAAPALRSGEIIIKRGVLDLTRPSKSLFAEKATSKAAVSCPACRPEVTSTETQDAKLKTKTVLVESHACKACKTVITRAGAQKATGHDVVQHTCGGMLAAAETCCSGMMK